MIICFARVVGGGGAAVFTWADGTLVLHICFAAKDARKRTIEQKHANRSLSGCVFFQATSMEDLLMVRKTNGCASRNSFNVDAIFGFGHPAFAKLLDVYGFTNTNTLMGILGSFNDNIVLDLVQATANEGKANSPGSFDWDGFVDGDFCVDMHCADGKVSVPFVITVLHVTLPICVLGELVTSVSNCKQMQ